MISNSYTTIEELIQSKGSGPYNIFGIIKYRNQENLLLNDEFYEGIIIGLSTEIFPLPSKFKPGDILRIHRLISNLSYSWNLDHESSLLMFSSFKDHKKDPKIKLLSRDCVLELFDLERRNELEIFLSDTLLSRSFDKMLWTVKWMDIVCQVVNINNVSHNRVILTVKDGTIPRIQFNNFGQSFENQDHSNVCISVWDQHSFKAKKLNKGDIIIIFNLENKSLSKDRNELNLRGGSHYGKCIRKIHHNSILAIKFRERFKEKNTQLLIQDQNINVNSKINIQFPSKNVDIEHNSEKFLVPSRFTPYPTKEIKEKRLSKVIIEPVHDFPSDAIINMKKNYESALTPIKPTFSGFRSSTPINQDFCEGSLFNELNSFSSLSDNELQIEFPIFLEFEIPQNMTIKAYLEEPINFCSIDAKIVSLKSKKFISLRCKYCNFDKIATKRNTRSLSRNNKVDEICPNCSTEENKVNLKAHFRINLTLMDKQNSKLEVELREFELRKLINIKPMDFFYSKDVSTKLMRFINEIFPADKFLYLRWVINKLKKKDTNIHKVMTIKRLE